MAVIREKRQYKVQPIGVARGSRGGEIVANAIVESANAMSDMFYKKGLQLASQEGADRAEALDIETITGIDPVTKKPIALTNTQNLGSVAMESFKRVVDRRFTQSYETEIQNYASTLATRLEENPNEVALFEQGMAEYLAEMTQHADGEYKQLILDTGKLYLANNKAALQEKAIIRQKAEAKAILERRKEESKQQSFNLGAMGDEGSFLASINFSKEEFTDLISWSETLGPKEFTKESTHLKEQFSSFAAGLLTRELSNLNLTERQDLEDAFSNPVGANLTLNPKTKQVHDKVLRYVENDPSEILKLAVFVKQQREIIDSPLQTQALRDKAIRKEEQKRNAFNLAVTTQENITALTMLNQRGTGSSASSQYLLNWLKLQEENYNFYSTPRAYLAAGVDATDAEKYIEQHDQFMESALKSVLTSIGIDLYENKETPESIRKILTSGDYSTIIQSAKKTDVQTLTAIKEYVGLDKEGVSQHLEAVFKEGASIKAAIKERAKQFDSEMLLNLDQMSLNVQNAADPAQAYNVQIEELTESAEALDIDIEKTENFATVKRELQQAHTINQASTLLSAVTNRTVLSELSQLANNPNIPKEQIPNVKNYEEFKTLFSQLKTTQRQKLVNDRRETVLEGGRAAKEAYTKDLEIDNQILLSHIFDYQDSLQNAQDFDTIEASLNYYTDKVNNLDVLKTEADGQKAINTSLQEAQNDAARRMLTLFINESYQSEMKSALGNVQGDEEFEKYFADVLTYLQNPETSQKNLFGPNQKKQLKKIVDTFSGDEANKAEFISAANSEINRIKKAFEAQKANNRKAVQVESMLTVGKHIENSSDPSVAQLFENTARQSTGYGKVYYKDLYNNAFAYLNNTNYDNQGQMSAKKYLALQLQRRDQIITPEMKSHFVAAARGTSTEYGQKVNLQNTGQLWLTMSYYHDQDGNVQRPNWMNTMDAVDIGVLDGLAFASRAGVDPDYLDEIRTSRSQLDQKALNDRIVADYGSRTGLPDANSIDEVAEQFIGNQYNNNPNLAIVVRDYMKGLFLAGHTKDKAQEYIDNFVNKQFLTDPYVINSQMGALSNKTVVNLLSVFPQDRKNILRFMEQELMVKMGGKKEFLKKYNPIFIEGYKGLETDNLLRAKGARDYEQDLISSDYRSEKTTLFLQPTADSSTSSATFFLVEMSPSGEISVSDLDFAISSSGPSFETFQNWKTSRESEAVLDGKMSATDKPDLWWTSPYHWGGRDLSQNVWLQNADEIGDAALSVADFTKQIGSVISDTYTSAKDAAQADRDERGGF